MGSHLEQIFERISLLDYSSIRGESPLIRCFLILLVDTAEQIGSIGHLIQVLSRCIERALKEIARIAPDQVVACLLLIGNGAVSLLLVKVCASGGRIVGPHV